MAADPNANAGQVVGNPKAITLNGGTADMTTGGFLTMIRGYVDRHSQMYDGQGLPTAQNIRENYQAQEQARRDYPGNPEMGDRYVSYYEQHGGQVLRADHMSDQANMDIINAGITGPSFKATQNARRPLQRDTQGAPQSGTGSTRRSRSMLMPCGILSPARKRRRSMTN